MANVAETTCKRAIKKTISCRCVNRTTCPVNNNLMHFFNVFISLLYMFLAIQCSSLGESIVSIYQLVYITMCRWPSGMQVRENSLTCTLVDILIQLILLMMSTVLLETCTEVK